MQNEILLDRENRQVKINKLLEKYPSVISIHANIMGNDKCLFESYYLTNHFLSLVAKSVKGDTFFYQGKDGPAYLIGTNEKKLKELLMKTENENALGRYIDLDVYENKNTSTSRKERRKCIICGDEVAVCSRLKRHSTEELLTVLRYELEKHLLKEMEALIDAAIIEELELEDKFGLVTKTSSGSHLDMDYHLMLKAKNAIVPYLVKAFELGYKAKDLKTILKESRPIGIEAEQKMFAVTKGVNCYKGLIFVFGIVLMSVGYTFRNLNGFEDIFANVKTIAKDVLNSKTDPKTFGYLARAEHNFKGVLGEIQSGLSTVYDVCLDYIDKELSLNDKYVILKELILNSEDSVFLKRAGSLNNYYVYTQMLKNVDVTREFERVEFTKYAIYRNLSFGGSADLLIVLFFILKIKKKMDWSNYEKNN